MIFARDRTQLVEDLARMMDELCAPELTLARAEVLRPRVARLLAALRESNDRPRPLAVADRLEDEPAMAGIA